MGERQKLSIKKCFSDPNKKDQFNNIKQTSDFNIRFQNPQVQNVIQSS